MGRRLVGRNIVDPDSALSHGTHRRTSPRPPGSSEECSRVARPRLPAPVPSYLPGHAKWTVLASGFVAIVVATVALNLVLHARSPAES